MHSALLIHASVLDPEGMLRGFGSLALVGAMAILFIECGVIFGAILPGDSLLFILGALVATGFIDMPLYVVLPLLIAAAFAGKIGRAHV